MERFLLPFLLHLRLGLHGSSSSFYLADTLVGRACIIENVSRPERAEERAERRGTWFQLSARAAATTVRWGRSERAREEEEGE